MNGRYKVARRSVQRYPHSHGSVRLDSHHRALVGSAAVGAAAGADGDGWETRVSRRRNGCRARRVHLDAGLPPCARRGLRLLPIPFELPRNGPDGVTRTDRCTGTGAAFRAAANLRRVGGSKSSRVESPPARLSSSRRSRRAPPSSVVTASLPDRTPHRGYSAR